ncbi:cell division protein ZapA [bacterium]|nr:MAG: cell division protein ZapA [bacterium]
MQSVEVQILGQSYSVKTDQDAEHIKKIAQYVDGKLREIYSTAPNVNQTKASIMVALGIADELFKIRIEQESLDKMIEEKTKMLSSFLE